MERADAVAVLADYLRSDALVGCVSDSILRKAYVDEYYGRSVQIGRELSPKTARSHKKLVRSTLSDIEKRAMEMIDARLREAGIVGDEN